MSQATQDGQTGGHGVRSRGQTLVGQGLPGGENSDVTLRQVAGQRRGGLLRLTGGRGDDQQRCALTLGRGGVWTRGGRGVDGADGSGDPVLTQRHGGQDGWPGPTRDHGGAVRARGRARGAHECGGRRVGQENRKEGGQSHRRGF